MPIQGLPWVGHSTKDRPSAGEPFSAVAGIERSRQFHDGFLALKSQQLPRTVSVSGECGALLTERSELTDHFRRILRIPVWELPSSRVRLRVKES